MRSFNRKFAVAGLALGLSAAPSLASASYEGHAEGSLSDWDTVDYVYFNADDDQELEIYVEASGPSDNLFMVKVQQETAGGWWDTLQWDYVDRPGGEGSLLLVQDVKNYVVGSEERLRVRMSRQLGSKSVVWYVGVNWN